MPRRAVFPPVAPGSMATYSFPLLPPGEVVTCLGELGLTATEAQLAKPDPEWVGALFEALVCSLVGVSRCGPRTRAGLRTAL